MHWPFLLWFTGAREWLYSLSWAVGQAEKPLPISVIRFVMPEMLLFYLYYWSVVGIFYAIWSLLAPHPWQRWSILGSALIIFITWFSVQVSLAINQWYNPFYNLIQKALTTPNSVEVSELYLGALHFITIANVAMIVSVSNVFFVSHYAFRWRTAMNNYYAHYWQQLRTIEGAAQRVQEDTMRFSATLESMGAGFINAIMTLIVFFPVLVALSHHVKSLPLVGEVHYGLVWAAILWSLFDTVLLAAVGIKLPGLAFRNQRVEAAYRNELIYGEDDESRARPVALRALFTNVRVNYFRLYFHYLYFNIVRYLYLQTDNIFGLVVLFPTIAAGAITLGLMQQITNVFDQVRSSFQFLVTSWTTIIELMSIYKRLRSFEQTLGNASVSQEIVG